MRNNVASTGNSNLPMAVYGSNTVSMGMMALNLCLIVTLVSLAKTHGQERQSTVPDRTALDTSFRQSLNDLAALAREQQQEELAEEIERWLIPRLPDRQLCFWPTAQSWYSEDSDSSKHSLAQATQQPSTIPGTETDQGPGTLRQRFQRIRRQHAQGLWELARQLVERGDRAEGYRLVHEVLHEDPEHESAARMLGLKLPLAQEAFVIKSPQRARRSHRVLGWPARTYWQLHTEHFHLVSNHSPQTLQDLARELERSVWVFRQIFLEAWCPEAMFSKGWTAGRIAFPSLRCRVVLFRDREEYRRYLQPREPQVAMTLGMYRAQDRTAYFYHAKRPPRTTWRHEATHQLLHETLARVPAVGESSLFWLVEGVALYLESMRVFPGYGTVGGLEAPRLQMARYRALHNKQHVPLSELSQWGRPQLQADVRVRELYSQAAGCTHFLMDHRGGKYRSALLNVLRQVYRGSADPRLLEREVKVPLHELDREYLDEFLPVNDARLAAVAPWIAPRQLVVGHCPITVQGVHELSRMRLDRLTWLDLTACPVPTLELDWLSAAKSLRQLSLEATRFAQATPQVLSQLAELEELDLSSTPVTSADLSHLSSLERLRVLHLTNTNICDAGLLHLRRLPALRYLELSGTRVTSGGVAALQAVRPELRVDGAFSSP